MPYSTFQSSNSVPELPAPPSEPSCLPSIDSVPTAWQPSKKGGDWAYTTSEILRQSRSKLKPQYFDLAPAPSLLARTSLKLMPTCQVGSYATLQFSPNNRGQCQKVPLTLLRICSIWDQWESMRVYCCMAHFGGCSGTRAWFSSEERSARSWASEFWSYLLSWFTPNTTHLIDRIL